MSLLIIICNLIWNLYNSRCLLIISLLNPVKTKQNLYFCISVLRIIVFEHETDCFTNIVFIIDVINNFLFLISFCISVWNRGAVALDGRIEPGDMILQVNDINFENMSNDEAVRVLREVVQKPGYVSIMIYIFVII